VTSGVDEVGVTQETVARSKTLEAAPALSEVREQDARGSEAKLREEVARAATRIESLEAALARSEEREWDALRAEATLREEVETAATRIESLETAMERMRGEAVAWKEAGTWKPDLRAVSPLYRWPPLRSLYRTVVLRRAREDMRRREWANAARNFHQALACDNDLPYVWVEYGHALKESGSFGEAALAYRKVLLAVPDHPDIAQHLSFISGLIGASGSLSIPRAQSLTRSLHGSHLSRPDRIFGLDGLALSETDQLRQRELISRDIRLAFSLASD
jgi:tetratricopeptide (TPR) repeat protein